MSMLQPMRFLLAVLRRNDSTSQANLQWDVIVRHETAKTPLISSSRPQGEISNLTTIDAQAIVDGHAATDEISPRCASSK